MDRCVLCSVSKTGVHGVVVVCVQKEARWREVKRGLQECFPEIRCWKRYVTRNLKLGVCVCVCGWRLTILGKG